MTMREISVALEKINRRTHNNYCMDAALVGVKLDPIESARIIDTHRNSDQNKFVEQSMKEAQERKLKEMKERG